MAGGVNNFSPQQNWQSLGGNGLYGYNNQGGAGTPVARDEMDASRIGVGRIPSAEYPDGYLGTIRSRRDDRLLDSIKSRVNQKQYQRGVHKGERIDPASYMWPENLEPDRRLKPGLYKEVENDGSLVMMAKRNAPKMALAPAPHLVNDGKADVSANVPAEFNPRTGALFAHLKPRWQ